MGKGVQTDIEAPDLDYNPVDGLARLGLGPEHGEDGGVLSGLSD